MQIIEDIVEKGYLTHQRIERVMDTADKSNQWILKQQLLSPEEAKDIVNTFARNLYEQSSISHNIM